MALDRLVGTWNVTLEHVAMPEPVQGEHRYEHVLERAYVLLRTTYEHPDFPDALVVVDATSCHYFDVRGVSRVFDFAIDDRGWRMVRKDADFWQRSSATFVGPGAMAGVGENSHDGGTTWQHDFSITYDLLRPPGR